MSEKPINKDRRISWFLLSGTIVAMGALGLSCCGLGTALLLPAIQAVRESARREEAAKKLKQIGEAIQTYHDKYVDPINVADDESQLKIERERVEKMAIRFKDEWLEAHPEVKMEFDTVALIERD